VPDVVTDRYPPLVREPHQARKLAIELMIRSLRDLQVEQQQQAAFRPQI
jgi:hypothetical protein